MKTNKKRKIELKKIEVTKLTDSNQTGVKGGNIGVCSNVGNLLSLIKTVNGEGC